MRRIVALLGLTWGRIATLLALGLAYAAFEGVGVGTLLPVLRHVERGTGDGARLLALLGLAFLAVVGRQVFRYVHQVQAERTRFDAVARLRTQAYAAFLGAGVRFHASERQGRLVNVLTGEIERGSSVLPFVLQLGEAVILLSVYLVVLAYLAAWLVPVAVLAMVGVGFLVQARIRASRRVGGRLSAAYDQLHVTIAEGMDGIRLVKMRAQERREEERLDGIVRGLAQGFLRLCREKERIEVAVEPVMILGAFVALYVAVTAFGMTLASFGLFMFVLLRMVPLLKQLNVARQSIGSFLATLENVHATIARARASADVAGGTRAFPGLRRELALERVSFAHDDESAWALRDVTFTVPKGSLTAIVGRSGAGKSTLLDLIARLREPSAGDITLDGVSVRAFDVASVRARIGVVDQQGFLFNDTVANNIAYGLAGLPRAAVVEAARRAHADEFIEALPHGYETVVGDRGVRLSAGQRQRLSLARVLVQNPDVLLLDEPTSALDSESEQYIQTMLDELKDSAAIVVVAHRLSTIKRADQIVVLDEGRVVEHGDHESLLQEWGTYKRLFDLQIQV